MTKLITYQVKKNNLIQNTKKIHHLSSTCFSSLFHVSYDTTQLGSQLRFQNIEFMHFAGIFSCSMDQALCCLFCTDFLLSPASLFFTFYLVTGYIFKACYPTCSVGPIMIPQFNVSSALSGSSGTLVTSFRPFIIFLRCGYLELGVDLQVNDK